MLDVIFTPVNFLNDHISGTPSLCYQADRLVESSAIGRCSGNGRRAEAVRLA